MNQKFLYILVSICLLFFTSSIFAKGPVDKRSLRKANVSTARTLSNISNWSYWMYDNGTAGVDPNGNSGGIYPRGTAGAIFQDGFVFGGRVIGAGEPEVRVGGQTYATGTQAGWVEGSGADARAIDANNADARMYRIRADWRTLAPALVRAEAAEANQTSASAVSDGQIQEIIDQYKTDWIEWPVDLGAPYIDVNGNGEYDPVLDGDGAADALRGDYPGIANADQVVWQVVNDFNNDTAIDLYGSPTIGVELQITAWGYDQDAATLGQVIFKKYRLINKSTFNVEDMYVGQWSDPDLGGAGDDLVGCDTTLSLGFAYNGSAVDASYEAFGLNPAVVGYDFFQGPLVDGVAGQDLNRNGVDDAEDFGVFDLQRVGPGKINLPMTSFGWFASGSDISDPPLSSYNGTVAWYNLLRGYIPTTNSVNDFTPYTWGNIPVANGGTPTKFPLAGDPLVQSDTEDIDGGFNGSFGPGDRRMALGSGPFTLASGDTQEVVVAFIGGTGSDFLTNVNIVKDNDAVAQKLYDDLFATVPKPPAPPAVRAVTYRDSIVLEWGSDVAAVATTESANPVTGYDFQGYNVYQLPSPTAGPDEAIRLATFDLIDGVQKINGTVFVPALGDTAKVVVQSGGDFGIARHFTIRQDAFSGDNIYPGNTYYFAVTAYNYNADPKLIQAQALESSIIIVDGGVTAQDPDPGMIVSSGSVTLDLSAVNSDGQASATIINPEDLIDDSYEIFFQNFDYIEVSSLTTTTYDTLDTLVSQGTGDSILVLDSTVTEIPDTAIHTALGWNVRNSAGEVLVANQFQSSSLAERADQPIFDGVQVKVSGPPLAINDWHYESGAVSTLYPDYTRGRWFTGGGHGGSGFFGGLFIHENFWGTSRVEAKDLVEVRVDFTPITGYTDLSENGVYDIGEDYTFDTDKGQKAFMYATWGAGNYLGYFDVPFQAFDISDPENPRQLNIIVRDRNQNHLWDLHDLYELDTPGGPVPIDTRFNYVFIMNTDYDPAGATYDPAQGGEDIFETLASAGFTGAIPAYFTMWFDQRGDREFLAEGGSYTITPNFVNTESDVFKFATSQAVFDDSQASNDVEKINVFPNPYYADNAQELTRNERRVTFTHLPKKANIRIFNLAGQQVRLLEKDGDGQFQIWDLRNESNLPVASGLYIAYIDMPDLGKEKVLKFFIIQKAEVLDIF